MRASGTSPIHRSNGRGYEKRSIKTKDGKTDLSNLHNRDRSNCNKITSGAGYHLDVVFSISRWHAPNIEAPRTSKGAPTALLGLCAFVQSCHIISTSDVRDEVGMGSWSPILHHNEAGKPARMVLSFVQTEDRKTERRPEQFRSLHVKFRLMRKLILRIAIYDHLLSLRNIQPPEDLSPVHDPYPRTKVSSRHRRGDKSAYRKVGTIWGRTESLHFGVEMINLNKRCSFSACHH